MVFEKKLNDLKFFPQFWPKTLFFADFHDWKKFSNFFLISLIGGNPADLDLYHGYLGLILNLSLKYQMERNVHSYK